MYKTTTTCGIRLLRN